MPTFLFSMMCYALEQNDFERCGVQPKRGLLTLPNILTVSRIVGLPFLLWWMISGRPLVLVLAVYGILVATDFLDGQIARRTNAVSTLGEWLDPLADKVFVLPFLYYFYNEGALMGGLFAAILLREVIVVFFRVVAAMLHERTPSLLMGKIKVVCEYTAIFFYLAGFWYAGMLAMSFAVAFAYLSLAEYEMEWGYVGRWYLRIRKVI